MAATAHEDRLAMMDYMAHMGDIKDTPTRQLMDTAIESSRRNRITESGNLQSEADAARRLKQCDYLPKDGTRGAQQAEWEALGFVFGKDKDDLYRNVEFPLGWSLENRESDSRHLTVVDDRGQARGGLSAKHTFYDRWANCSLKRRISISNADYVLPSRRKAVEARRKLPRDQRGVEEQAVVITYVQSGVNYPQQAVLLKAGVFKATPADDGWEAQSAASEQVNAAAKAWLAENYPEWEDKGAYWDIEIPGGVFGRE